MIRLVSLLPPFVNSSGFLPAPSSHLIHSITSGLFIFSVGFKRYSATNQKENLQKSLNF